MSIKYNYNRTGTERKALVDAVSRILEEPAIYLGAPTFAYAVGNYRISKKGSLFSMNDAGREEMEHLVSCLQEQGFAAEGSSMGDSPAVGTVTDAAEAAAGNVAGEAAPDDSDGDNTLTIELPKTGFTSTSLDNLHKIIASKEALLKKALDTDNLAVIDTGNTLKFPWFTLHGLTGEADACSRLVAAMCNMAKKQKRVTAKEQDTGNDKFNMRLFLVRLGFVGDEYKAARKLLLRNLTGNSSWKSGHAPQRTASDTEASPASQIEMEGGETYGK